MLDRKKLRDLLTVDHIVHLMSLLGAKDFSDEGEYLKFHTICHNEDEMSAGMNLTYYKESHRFFCFSNCHSMDIFQVVKKRWELLDSKEDTHFENLAYWVLNHSEVDLDEATPAFVTPYSAEDYDIQTKEIILPERSTNILDVFSNYHCVEWLKDGISDAAMDKYNILYSTTRNAIIIPHYDVNGRLVGVRRRALDEDDLKTGKYKPIYIQGISCSHPLGYNLYGLNLIKEEVKRRGKIIIAEGEKSPLQSYSIYGENNYVAAACGNRINRWQVWLIMKYCQPREIILAFDKGIEYSHLENLCKKYSSYCQMSFTYDWANQLKDKESPFDRPELLEDLLHNRVKIKI